MKKSTSRLLFIVTTFAFISACSHQIRRDTASDSLSPAQLKLAQRNPANNERQEIPISTFMQTLDAQGKLRLLQTQLQSQLEMRVPDPVLRAPLSQMLAKAFADKDWEKLDGFPVLPIRGTERMQLLIAGMDLQEDTVQSKEAIAGDFTALFNVEGAECKLVAKDPRVFDEKVPLLTEGHFPDASLDQCFVHKSLLLAEVLNGLSVQGSDLRYGGERIRSVSMLFSRLMDNGHTVRMIKENTYANFISLNFGDSPIIWPVWVDSGEKTQNKKDVKVPVLHSHFAWEISGPLVQAKVLFYLGISGVGYFASVHERPRWTGYKVLQDVNSTSALGKAKILNALQVASRYELRTRFEAGSIGKGLPADAYGYLGVCNDSAGVIEALVMSNAENLTSYPLLRAPGLDKKGERSEFLMSLADRGSRWDAAIENYYTSQRPLDLLRAGQIDPHSQRRGPTRAELLSRLWKSLPFATAKEAYILSEDYEALLKDLEAEFGR